MRYPPDPSDPPRTMPAPAIDLRAGPGAGPYGDGPYDESLYDDGSYDEEGPGFRRRLLGLVLRPVRPLAWLAVAAAVAVGSAGMVAAIEHPPAGGARLELTWGADQQLARRLDAAVSDLVKLSDDVTVLGTMSRQVLSNLTQLNQVGLQAAWADGDRELDLIDGGATAIRAHLDCPSSATSMTARTAAMAQQYSPAVIERFRRICEAVDATAPLAGAWKDMTGGSARALQVAQLIAQHDQLGGDALQLATKAKYKDALAKLKDAAASLGVAEDLSAQMALMTNVGTLKEWLSRTHDMDDALRLLWGAMLDSGGKTTPQVVAALKLVKDAQALLPADSRVVTVVVYEMSTTLTDSGISIETAKGRLATAVNDLSGGVVVGR